MAATVGLVVVAVVLGVAAATVRARGGGGAIVRGLALAAVLVALAALVFGLVASDESLAAADGPLLGRLVALRSPGLTAAAETLSLVGGTVGTGGLAVAAALVLALRGRRRRAIVWVVAVGVGSLTIRGLKETVERPRPPVATRLAVETSTSLPSGHSLMAALGIGLTVVAVLVLLPADRAVPPDDRVGGRWRRAVRGGTVLVGVLLVAAIGASRAYLGVHWTTDVTAGWLLGAALTALAVAVATGLEQRDSDTHPSEGVDIHAEH